MEQGSSRRGGARLGVLLALALGVGACASGAGSDPSLPTVPTTGAPAPTDTAPPTTATVATTAPATPSRQDATTALCRSIDAAAAAVARGRLAAGGLRLSSAVNTYQATADPAVSGPARRMLSSAVAGDLEASGDAAQEASAACARRGTSVRLPGGVQCVTTPCP